MSGDPKRADHDWSNGGAELYVYRRSFGKRGVSRDYVRNRGNVFACFRDESAGRDYVLQAISNVSMKRGALDNSPTMGSLGSDAGANGIGTGSLAWKRCWPLGYPSSGPYEPNVTCQFIMNQASGNIVDVVSALSLATTGTPTYSRKAGGIYQNISPGIRLNANGDHFGDTTAEAQLNLATNDFVVDWYASLSSAGTVRICDFADAASGYYIEYDTTGTFTVSLTATDATNVTCNFSTTKGNDGRPHYWRVAGDRSGTLTFHIDGESQGTPVNISALVAKNINGEDRIIGGGSAGGGTLAWTGTIYMFRLTAGNCTNNLWGK